MKKCFGCGITKGLKAIQQTDCDCGKCQGFHNQSVCKDCYFSDMVSCDMDLHTINDCLKSPNCENHKDTLLRKDHWNELDYHYNPKKGVVLTV